MPLSASQLQAYLNDAGIVAADQAKLTADEATEANDSTTVATGLPPEGQAVLSADGKTVTTFDPIQPPTTPPSFVTHSYTIAS